MIGDVVVMEPAKYKAWLSGGISGATFLPWTGQNLFTTNWDAAPAIYPTGGKSYQFSGHF